MRGDYVRSLTCCFLLLGVAPVAWAQKNFQPGYIVRPSGDTLRGEVSVRGPQRMAHQCLFRPSASATATEYEAAELKAYGLREGARYEACQVPTATPAAPTPSVSATVFLQILAQGKATLYTTTDDNDKVRYYFRHESGPVTELTQLTQIIQVHNQAVQEVTYPFRQVLSYAFADCLVVQPLLVKATLTASQLTNIFNQYNACGPGQPAAPVPYARTTKVRLSFLVGAQSGSTTLYDEDEKILLHSAWRPMVGIGLLLNPATFNSKVGVRIEAFYQTQEYAEQYQHQVGTITSLSSTRDALFVLKTLRVPIMLRYTLPTGKLRPYVQIGGEAAVELGRQGQIVESYNYAGTRQTSTTPIQLRGFGTGATAGIGLLIPGGAAGAVQVEARINRLDRASAAIGELKGPTTLSFLLGYNLGK